MRALFIFIGDRCNAMHIKKAVAEESTTARPNLTIMREKIYFFT
jgi:hypothetical protein